LCFVRSSRRDHPFDGVILAVPFFFHLFFFSALFWAGFYRQAPMLALIAAVMFFIGMLLHIWPSWTWVFGDAGKSIVRAR
jgi:hypothetical protein